MSNLSNWLFFRMTWTIRRGARAATLTTTTTTTTAAATKTAAATILDPTNTIDTNKQKKKLFQLFLHDGRILLTNIIFKLYVFHT